MKLTEHQIKEFKSYAKEIMEQETKFLSDEEKSWIGGQQDAVYDIAVLLGIDIEHNLG